METRAILLISSVLFACGLGGLVTVRLTNPFFKGLGWLAGSFGAGALGAILFAINPIFSTGLAVIAPNSLIVLAYVFLHLGLVELLDGKPRIPRVGATLLIAQPMVCLLCWGQRNFDRDAVAILGVLLAVQCVQSAIMLRKFAQPGLLEPSWFCITLLCAFAAYNCTRSVVVLLSGVPQSPQLSNPLELTSALVFLGVGLGLGFGVFWIASSQLRIALEEQASIDPLTGLCNRRVFMSHSERELSRSRRVRKPCSLFLLDIDYFKKINDLHGHRTGDAVLCAVAEKLRESVREIDFTGRWGGEEFVALLPGADADTALAIARRMRIAVESLLIADFLPRETAGTEKGRVTVSIGVATYVGPAENFNDLLHRCDVAMYQAKASGRNRIVFTQADEEEADIPPMESEGPEDTFLLRNDNGLFANSVGKWPGTA